MALWMDYSIATDDVDMVVTVRWRTTQAGAVVHIDDWRYRLTDPAVVGDGAQALADRIVRDVRRRAGVIDRGVQVYAGVQAALAVPPNTVVQIL